MRLKWFKDRYFWRKPSPEWEIENYTQAVDSKGDLIFNTLSRIVDQEDKSDWAYGALEMCRLLLFDRRRWPCRMNQDIDSKTRIGWRWSQLIQRTGLRKTVKYRPRHQMTRDPYWVFYCACVVLDKKEYINEVKIPWYLYRSEMWIWRKRLIEDKRRDYVKRLEYYKSLTFILNQ